MKFNNLVLLSLFVLVLLPMVSAAPPILSASMTDEGLAIEESVPDSIPINHAYDFYVHVYNQSNGRPMYSPIQNLSCYMHIYSARVFGEHIFSQATGTPNNIFDYEFSPNANNFTTAGSYTYITHCNTSNTRGGYISGSFEVTPNGNEIAGDCLIIFFNVIFLAVICFMLYLIIYSLKHGSEGDFDLYDLALNYGTYFAFVAYYYLEVYYVGNPFIDSISSWIIYLGVITNIFIATIYLIWSITTQNLKTNKQSAGEQY